MSNQIAQTIADQIGRRALTMIGASTFLALESALAFKVGRNPKGASHVTVTLAPDDTYTVKSERLRMSRATMAVSRKLRCPISFLPSWRQTLARSCHWRLPSLPLRTCPRP